MTNLSLADLSGNELIELAKKLYVALEESKILAKHFKERAVILRTVFSLLDQYDTRLMLLLSRIILAVRFRVIPFQLWVAFFTIFQTFGSLY